MRVVIVPSYHKLNTTLLLRVGTPVSRFCRTRWYAFVSAGLLQRRALARCFLRHRLAGTWVCQ